MCTLWFGSPVRTLDAHEERLPALRPHFEREHGYWAGALAINFICTGGLLLVSFALGLVFTLPDVNVVLMLAVLAPIAILGPIVWYPFSKTLWVAIDRAILQRLDPNEQPDD